MNRKEIHFEISPEGEIQFTVKGIRGKGCEAVAQALNELGEVTGEEKTSEYYQQQAPTVHVRTNAGKEG